MGVCARRQFFNTQEKALEPRQLLVHTQQLQLEVSACQGTAQVRPQTAIGNLQAVR